MVYIDNDKSFEKKDDFLKYVVDKFYEEIIMFIYKSVRNFDDAEDIVQETFFSFYRSLDRFRFDSSVKTYLYKIAINNTINHQNKKSRESNKIISFLSKLRHEGNTCRKHQDFEDNDEISKIIKKALSSFPARQKIILSLRLFKDLKIREIAEMLSISEGNVKSQISTGLKKLQIELKENGYGM